MSLVLHLMLEEILFIVSLRHKHTAHKHTASLHCDMVLRNADMYMELNVRCFHYLCVMCFIPRKLLS